MKPAAFHGSGVPGAGADRAGHGGIRVHIDHLILEGLPFDAVQARRLQASLVEAVTRRLTEDPSAVNRLSRQLPPAGTGSITLPAASTPEAAGLAIAHALFHDGPGFHRTSVTGTTPTAAPPPGNP